MYGKAKAIKANVRKYNGRNWEPLEKLVSHTLPISMKCLDCGYVMQLPTQTWEKRTILCPVCNTPAMVKAKHDALHSQYATEIYHLRTMDTKELIWKYTPFSKKSHGEAWIKFLLDSIHIPYTMQVSFKDLKSPRNYRLRYDFMVAGKLLIEYDGEQHRRYSGLFNGYNPVEFQYRQKCDALKTAYAESHGYPLFRVETTSVNRLKKLLADALSKA